MKALRRWFIYRRLVTELSDMPAGALAELGTWRKAIHEFAWQSARLDVEREALVARGL